MEFCGNLTRIQGALVTLSRKNGLRRDEADSKGGNKNKSPFYYALQKIISEYEDNESELRKTHLYLLLNADFCFNEEVAKEDDFCHIVYSAPTIDKYLLVETISSLNLAKFTCEIIEFAHVALCLEYLDVLLCENRFTKSLSDISAVETILLAVNKRLLSLEKEKNTHQELGKKAKCKLSKNFKELLKIYSPPHREKEMGFIINSLLSLLQSCLSQRCISYAEIDEKYKIYSMTLKDYIIESLSENTLNLGSREDVIYMINLLELNLNLVDLSTWMSWSECNWQPAVDSGEYSSTVQEVIGHQAFLCKQELEKFCADMPEAAVLSAVLANMAIKPITDEDEIEQVEEASHIICKLLESNRPLESKRKWLRALLKFSWYLREEECVNCIQEFGNLLDCMEDIHLLQKKVGEFLTSDSIHKSSKPITSKSELDMGRKITDSIEDKMKKLVFEAYPRISVENQGKLVGNFYEEFGLVNCFYVEDFEATVTKTFNKAVNVSGAKDQLLSDICTLCLQSPVDTVQRVLLLGIGCSTQIPFAIEVLKTLSLVCQLPIDRKSYFKQHSIHQSPDSGITLLCSQFFLLTKQNNWNEMESSNLLQLVAQCLDSSLLLHDNLLLDCIIPVLEECMENSSWNTINMHIEMLNTVLTASSSSLMKISNPAPILAYIMVILEKGRYDMRKIFSVQAAATCELIITYLPVLLKEMLDQASFKEKDLDWLRRSVLAASPQCQLHYSQLWPSPMNTVIKDFKSLIMFTVYKECNADEKRLLDLITKDCSKLSHYLFTLLPSCTTSEWLNVTKALKSLIPNASNTGENLFWNVLQVISSVLLVMIITAKRKYLAGDKSIQYCIELWFKSYIRIIKEEFFPSSLYFNAAQSTVVFTTVIMILNEVPEDEIIRETCSFLALNILSEIVESLFTPSSEGKDSKSMEHYPELTKIVACISLMSEGESKKGLARKVQELLSE